MESGDVSNTDRTALASLWVARTQIREIDEVNNKLLTAVASLQRE